MKIVDNLPDLELLARKRGGTFSAEAPCGRPLRRAPSGIADSNQGDQLSDFHNEREFELAAKASVEQTLQRMMDRLQRECEGKSVEEAKQRLANAWVDATDEKITDPELTTYAKELAVGNRVIIRLE